ncbi:YidH family protein [Mycolicibacterium mageritense]|uniref:YidH family protein n=1 Tax=Mycolicibacterium mageritense TaxID=53462 RepID=UPI001E38C186|nr:DUF202 domain-containing protein [Mycolicibacterium mageritense]GJJ20542.1 hypothetical protein MTY414_42150 [Mycolicibacterium mageritense]
MTDDHEPDYRFTLANERTFLAWIRTALGLLAGGVAVNQLLGPFRIEGARTTLVTACLVMALVLAGGAYFHWRAVQSAMRHDAPLPRTRLVPFLAAGAVVIALVASVAILAP